jgi:hypothetical protein
MDVRVATVKRKLIGWTEHRLSNAKSCKDPGWLVKQFAAFKPDSRVQAG